MRYSSVLISDIRIIWIAVSKIDFWAMSVTEENKSLKKSI